MGTNLVNIRSVSVWFCVYILSNTEATFETQFMKKLSNTEAKLKKALLMKKEFNCVKVGREVTFMKYLASIVTLIFLLKTLIWNKITFPVSDLLNFAELVKNELMKSIYIKKFLFLSNLSLLIVKVLRASTKELGT